MRAPLLALTLAGLCACSAVAVVYSTHLSRVTFREISHHQRLIDALDVRWSQLQIEEGTFSEHGRIERAARSRLDMTVPGIADSEMIIR